MTQLQTKTVIDPNEIDTLNNLKLDIFSSLNCVKIGSIQSFDATKRTAQVQILFKMLLPDGTTQSVYPIVDVPVFTLQGGGASLQMPIAAGDQCILLFSDRRIDEWFFNGAEAVPGSARMHDLSDGIALVGLNALSSNLPIYPSNKVILTYNGSTFSIGSNVDLKSSGGAEVELDTLVSIKNSATTLLVCLTNLITALESLTVTVTGSSGIVSAATIAALAVVQNTLNTLLE